MLRSYVKNKNSNNFYHAKRTLDREENFSCTLVQIRFIRCVFLIFPDIQRN